MSIFSYTYGRCQERRIISLEDALNIHLFKTNNIQIQRNIYQNAELEYEIYKKELLPSVVFNLSPLSFNHSLKLLQNAASGEYTNIEEFSNSISGGITIKQGIGLTGGIFSLATSLDYIHEFSSSSNNFSSRPMFVNYTQQLFGGRKNYKYKKEITKKTHTLAKKKFISAITSEQLTMLQLYFDAYSAKIDKEYYEKLCAIGDTLLKQAKMKFNVGKITEYELNQLELQQMGNLINQQKSTKEHSRAIRLIEIELGLKGLDVCQPNEYEFPLSIDYDDVLNLIKKNNPEYFNYELQRLNAEYNLYNYKIGNRFNANISLTYGFNQFGRSLFDSYKHPNQQQAISVTLSIPMFDWGANRARVKIKQNEYDNLSLQQEIAMNRFQEQTLEIVNAYNRSVDMLAIAEKRYTLSKTQFEYIALRFFVGKLNFTELTTAENEQMKSKQEFINTMRELYTNYFRIRNLTMYDFIKEKNITELLR